MATKFYNNQARVFHRLLNGENFNDLLKSEKERFKNVQYYCSDEQAQKYREESINDVIEVKNFFDKIIFFETPEIYKVNGWGYEQTNYENLKVLGQVGGSMVVIIDNGHSDVYTIQKKKYTEKARYTKLDTSVRSTDWQEPFSNDAIAENRIYNAYYGH